MKKVLKMLMVGAFFLAGSALWAIGYHFVGSAERVLLAAVALALMGLVISL